MLISDYLALLLDLFEPECKATFEPLVQLLSDRVDKSIWSIYTLKSQV